MNGARADEVFPFAVKPHGAVRVALLALLSLSPVWGQELLLPTHSQPVQPQSAWQLEPAVDASPAWLLALWGVPPYAEIQAAGVPLPPSRAEVAALPAALRVQEQAALKAVWLELLLRSREERNRVSRENLSHCAALAARLGAPEVFVDLLRQQAEGGLSSRRRHALESAQQALLEAYVVDARELRFFVEGVSLSPAELRDEVASWLPLAGLFTLPASSAASPVSSRALGADYVELLAVLRDLAAAWSGVHDRASADAAADALLPVLARYMVASRSLLLAPQEQVSAVVAPYALYAQPIMAANLRERARLMEQGWFGSARLQALDYLFH